jgi:hypothetical protein
MVGMNPALHTAVVYVLTIRHAARRIRIRN